MYLNYHHISNFAGSDIFFYSDIYTRMCTTQYKHDPWENLITLEQSKSSLASIEGQYSNLFAMSQWETFLIFMIEV